jgi:tetratricopeptide (TPR) repeat protein
MANSDVDRVALVSVYAGNWCRWFKPEFAQVGLGLFNCKIGNPQLGLDVSFVSDFISPSEPRRWASLFMAQVGWGLKLWQEESTGWYSRLARAAIASPGKGIDYLWAIQNLKNPSQAKECLEKATKLFPNYSAWVGLAMLAKQEGDTSRQEKAIEEMKNILTENSIRDAANISKTAKGNSGKEKPEDIAKVIIEKGKARRNKIFQGLMNDGKLPWGNEKGEISFGFGYGGGPGLFHAGLLASGMKLFIPLLLNVKPDWLLLLYDMWMRSGSLSAYQLAPFYERLTERPSTRTRAISRLVQIHRYLENKEETLRWAICAAEESPQDIQTLQTAAWVAQWAGESGKAQDFSRKIAKENERPRSESVYSPQDEYLLIYQKINEADRHFHAKEIEKARHLYDRCLYGLETIKKKDPEWEPSIIRYRIKYLEQKLDEIDLRGENE